MTAEHLVQFFLIDHLNATAVVILVVCVSLKVWILYHCPSHPLYRGRS